MTSRSLPQAGFTLIEILIVTVLVSFLAFTTFTTVRSTLRAKEDIDKRTALLQESRAVLSILERDIHLAYFVTSEDFVWQAPAPTNPPTPPTPPPMKPLPVTIFQGHSNDIFMSSQSHQRMATDTPENEQHFVTYQITGGKLVRAESARAVSLKDRESPSKFHEFTLLEKVKTFNLAYWDARQEKWVDTWDTEKAEFNNSMPEAVKVEIEYTPSTVDERDKIEPVKIATSIRIGQMALKRATAKTQ